MNLRSVGYYKEMPQGKETSQSIHEVVKKGDSADVVRICEYLNNGAVLVSSPGITVDVIDESAGAVGTGSACTDGTWLWPDDLSHYVKKYNIKLPDEFIDTMRNNNWNNPGKNMDVGDEHIIIDGIEV